MSDDQQISIRRAVPSDAEAIAALTDAAYAKYVPRMGRKPQPMTVDYQQIVAAHPVWVLCVGQALAGVLVLMHEPDTLLVYSVAIHPDYQHRGFGRRLLAWAEQDARQAGYTRIRLYTNALMEENIALYQSLGYRETHREPFHGLTIVHLAKQLETIAMHPEHHRLVGVITAWFHTSFQAMGYRAEQHPWGTYWNTGHVYTFGFPVDQVMDFLADVRAYYGEQPVFINIDGRDHDATLGPALQAAGCTQGKTEIFLAHVGAVPQLVPVIDMAVEPMNEANLPAFAATRLKAFADSEATLTEAEVHSELADRRAELMGTGRGLLAHVGGIPAGVIWWLEDPRDIWVTYLATRVPFRGRGIGRWLLCQCLTEKYAQGCRSVLLNVTTDNVQAIQLYRRLGFVDEVYWRRRYT